MTSMDARLNAIARLMEAGEEDKAYVGLQKVLEEDPGNVRALVAYTHLLDQARRLPEAYAMAHLAAKAAPHVPGVWTNLGRIAEELYLYDESEKAHNAAVARSTTDKGRAMNLMNLSALYTQSGRWKAARDTAVKALTFDPEQTKARANLGIAQLALGDWEEGWKNYRHNMGSVIRGMREYGDAPWWDGIKGKRVVVWGEQGLGDEISFASMVPDAIRDCKQVILDVDARLKGLFKRSFPQATVYGTRWAKELDWSQADQSPDAHIAMGQLGEYYRRSVHDCSGDPYLVPCPLRAQQWKSAFAGIGKPVIGIAWTGGVQWTGAKFRHWELKDLLPLFNAVDAHWVSLQYKDPAREIAQFKADTGIEIHHYPWATITDDYDNTAALVSACTEVISMQTAVIHLAGALGVPTTVFVHRGGQWRYGDEKESMPWYRSVRIVRQTQSHDWAAPIYAVARRLSKDYAK